MNDSGQATSVVTGITSGLGRAIFRELAGQGRPVIGVSRPGERSRQALAEAREASGNPHLTLLEADLSLIGEMRGLAERIEAQCRENGGEFDSLVLNAATVTPRPETTEEGLDRMLAVNFLGIVALVQALELLIRQSPTSRICLVSSDAHRWCDWPALASYLDGKSSLPSLKGYGATKLAGLIYFAELARRWQEANVTAHHPGFVSTGLGLRGGWWLSLWWRLSRWRMRDPAEAARELLAVAESAPPLEGELRYWEQDRPAPLPEECAIPQICELLWQQSSDLVAGASSP